MGGLNHWKPLLVKPLELQYHFALANEQRITAQLCSNLQAVLVFPYRGRYFCEKRRKEKLHTTFNFLNKSSVCKNGSLKSQTSVFSRQKMKRQKQAYELILFLAIFLFWRQTVLSRKFAWRKTNIEKIQRKNRDEMPSQRNTSVLAEMTAENLLCPPPPIWVLIPPGSKN